MNSSSYLGYIRSKRIALLPLLAAWACSSSEGSLPASFAGPAGLAVAGPALDRLFIANAEEGTLQVAQLTTALEDIDFVRGDALHFPLRIGVGLQPREIAATPDGRYVVVLNGVGETLRLVDADALVPAGDAQGRAIIVPAGPAGSAPAALVAGSDAGCTAPCVGRFYVALSGTGAVAEVEVSEDAGAPALTIVRTLAVGGTPVGLAASPDGRWLFVTDAADGSVVRVDLAVLDGNFVTDRLPLGEAPGALTISMDGSALVVARPRLRDVVVIDTTTPAGSLAVLDADAPFAPAPVCVEACGATEPVCLGTHPADAAYCTTGTGLGETAAGPYTAVYLDVVPARMVALGTPGAAPGSPRNLRLTCGDEPGSEYNQFIAIAQTNGPVVFVGLRRATADGVEGPLDPELVTRDCISPSLITPEGAPVPADFLGTCPAHPERARFACIEGAASETDPDNPPGVLILRGLTLGVSGFTFDWEGIVAEPVTATGEIETSGITPAAGEASFAIRDIEGRFAATDVRPGDVLQIVTEPTGPCAELGDDPIEACRREWVISRIDEVDASDATQTRVYLEGTAYELGATCYPGAVQYRVRAGNSYLVRQGSSLIGRVAWGETIGRGTEVGRGQRVLVTFQPGEAPVARPPADPVRGLCNAYDLAGVPVSWGNAQMNARGAPFGYSLSDPFTPLRTGYDYDLSSTQVAGTLPGGMVVAQLPGEGAAQVIFVSYTASDSLLAFVPFDPNAYSEEDASRVLR